MIFSTESQTGFVVAVFIGLAFGFVLERAGFGRANKLAAQFYFRDLTVFKVMFTAIVTAMLGLVAFARFGLIELRALSEQIVSWTYIGPMLIGGLVLGAGFIISGYCPGTSIVAGASGNIDGAMTVVGVVAGTFVYTKLLALPAFTQWHESGEKGAWFLYDVIPVAPWVIALAIAVMAVLLFIAIDVWSAVAQPPLSNAAALPPHSKLALTFAALAAIILIARPIHSNAPPRAPRPMSTRELAQRVIEQPWTLRIIDTRPAAAFAKARIPGSENGPPTADPRRVVIVDAQRFAEWQREPLAQALAGSAPPPSAPIARPAGTFAKPKKKGGGCSS